MYKATKIQNSNSYSIEIPQFGIALDNSTVELKPQISVLGRSFLENQLDVLNRQITDIKTKLAACDAADVAANQ